ncbi:sulfotransferase [Mesobaculum littorinae]|uniref:sulfotransferase n=1 Tax=Mesobaculum littorinae TaxID=2486419 RepID=UPI001F23E396|nr:sulfotransferase [Mesobaculum littorinae]
MSEILKRHPAILSVSELFSTVGPHAFRPDRPSGAAFWRHLSRPSRALSRTGNPQVAPREFLYGRVPDPAHDPFLCPPILAITLPHLFADPDAVFATLARDVPTWPRRSLAAQYLSLFDRLAADLGGRRVWVERSGGSLVASGTLLRMFPAARPVLLTRSGPDTALSMRDYPATRLAIWMWRRLAPLGIDLLSPRHHYGRGAIWPLIAAAGGVAGLGPILSARPTLADCGAFWSELTRKGLGPLAGHAPLILSYESLCRAPQDEIRRLGLYLADEAPEAWVEACAALPQVRPTRLAALDPADRREVELACAPGEAALAAWTQGRSLP